MRSKSIQISQNQIRRNIAFYNEIRSGRSIEMLTPNQAHQKTSQLKRVWKFIIKIKYQRGKQWLWDNIDA